MASLHTRRLRALFQSILTLAVPTAGAGCGISTEGFDPVPCKGQQSDYLSGLALVEPADYLELRDISFEEDGIPPEQTHGTPCATATDAAACEAKIAAAGPTSGLVLGQCLQVCSRYLLLVNRGDDVTFVSTPDEARALLGPIDSPMDAIFRVKLEGYSVRCGDEDTGVREVDGGYEVLATRITQACTPVEKTLYRLSVTTEGSVAVLESETLSSDSSLCIGRRPAGLCARRARGRTRLGAYWGGVAHLEAASVHAFAVLARELAHHGAPGRLVRQAQRSKRDEVRHAAVTRRLAARHGSVAPKPKVERRAIRSLEELALENAAEGCVRETFGALVGSFQARFAAEPGVREAMRRIARDETRHAALAWAIDEWVRTRLSPEALQRVDEARRQALRGLLAGASRAPHPELVAGAGLPDAGTALSLARRFCEAVAG